MNLRRSYSVGQRLVHHSGAVWEVIAADLGGDGRTWADGMVLCQGDYRIQGVGESGRATGRTMRVHSDYLHGDGWKLDPGSLAEENERLREAFEDTTGGLLTYRAEKERDEARAEAERLRAENEMLRNQYEQIQEALDD